MREIKFRVWNYTYNKFIINEDVKTTIQMVEFFRYSTSAIMQQFTGLKDCKGREIYEGDIIEILYKNSSIKQNAKVVFEKGCFFADLGDRFAYHIYEVADNCEVIGNIHENPELLGGQND